MDANNTIPILEKAVAIIHALADSPEGVTAKSLSISLNIPPATCYRILRTFRKHNWLRGSDDGLYRIAFGLASMAGEYSEIDHLLRQLKIPLRALSDTTGLSVKVALREGDSAVTAVRMESRRPNAITSKVGSKMHLAEAGAAGAVLLAALPQRQVESILDTAPEECWSQYSREAFCKDVAQTRQQKISRALGKFHPSIYAIAVPLSLTPNNTAALAIIGWPDDFKGARRTAIEKQLKEHAAHIGKLIEHYSEF